MSKRRNQGKFNTQKSNPVKKINANDLYNVNAMREFGMKNLSIIYSKLDIFEIASFSNSLEDYIEICKYKNAQSPSFLPQIVVNSLGLFPETEVTKHPYFKGFKLQANQGQFKAFFPSIQNGYVNGIYIKDDKNKLDCNIANFLNKMLLFYLAFEKNNVVKANEMIQYFIKNIDQYYKNYFEKNDTLGEATIIDGLFTQFVKNLNPSFQKEIVEKHESTFLNSEKGTLFLLQINIELGKLTYASEIGEKALEDWTQKNVSNVTLKSLYENLLLLNEKRGYIEHALNYGLKALRTTCKDEVLIINEENEDLVYKLITNTCLLNDQTKFSQLISLLKDNLRVKTLFQQYNNFLNNMDEFKKEIVDSIKLTELPNKQYLKPLYHLTKFFAIMETKKESYNDKSFKDNILDLRKHNISFLTLIPICIKYKKFNIAQQFLKEAKKTMNADSEILLFIQAYLNDGKDNSLFNEIQKTNLSVESKAKIHSKAAESIIAEISPEDDDKTAKIKFESANKHIKEAFKSNPENTNNIKNALIGAVLSKDKVATKAIIKEITNNELKEIIAPFVKDNKTQEALNNEYSENLDQTVEQLQEEFDPKKIHAYYQNLKAQKLEQLSKPAPVGWKISEKTYIEFSEATYIGSHKGAKGGLIEYYAYLSPKIKKGNLEQLEQAINKGFVLPRPGKNGVKDLNEKAFEIKSNQDIRPITKDVYINKEDHALLFFEDALTHQGVEDYVQLSGGIEFHYV